MSPCRRTRDPRLEPARLHTVDLIRVGGAGLRARPARVLLSALGIAIGIAAMTAVVGISESSRADLDRQLAALGTNVLTVRPGQGVTGDETFLPDAAVAMIRRIPPVLTVTATGQVADADVFRNDRIPSAQSGGIAVLATQPDLLATVSTELASGTFLNPATSNYPAAVLGSTAARRLGITRARPDQLIEVGDEWVTVVGVLHPSLLAPELDAAALIGWPYAHEHLGFDGHPTTIYTRARDDSVQEVRDVLGRTANPERPNEVEVSRPSDALAARQAADRTLRGLLLGLGTVALVVGGVGVANTMVISVLERRSEIGLRRSLGATRHNIRTQFLAESLLLSSLGGCVGVLLGIAVTAGYATTQHLRTVVPTWASVGGLVATVAIGVLAGIYPAIRAARLSPTEALGSY